MKVWIPESVFEKDQKILIEAEKIIEKRTKFQEVLIAYSDSFGKMLFLDGDHQSSEKDEFMYHEPLVQPAMLMHSCPKKILILGAGEGATAREVLKHKTIEQIVAVDIDKEVIDLCKKYLYEMHQGSFSNPKVKLIYDDAMDYIKKAQEKKEKFDVIIADLTDPLSDIASEFYTKKFFSQLGEISQKDGIFATHAGSSDYFIASGGNFKRILADLKERFNSVLFYQNHIPSFFTTWGFVMASSDLKFKPEEIDKRIKERGIETRCIDGKAFLGMLSLPKHIREYIKL